MVCGPQISCKAQSSAGQACFTAAGAAGGQGYQQARPPSYRAYIDFRALKADLDRHVQNCSDRNSAGDPKAVAQLYDEWLAAQSKVEQLREERNANAQSMKVCSRDIVITGLSVVRVSTYVQPLNPWDLQELPSVMGHDVLARCWSTPLCRWLPQLVLACPAGQQQWQPQTVPSWLPQAASVVQYSSDFLMGFISTRLCAFSNLRPPAQLAGAGRAAAALPGNSRRPTQLEVVRTPYLAGMSTH